jgi:hypothetical protein
VVITLKVYVVKTCGPGETIDDVVDAVKLMLPYRYLNVNDSEYEVVDVEAIEGHYEDPIKESE